MIEKMKVVHIVAAASEKTALLDKLRELGVVHFAEKASADQGYLERFARLSRMEMTLQEYPKAQQETTVLSDSEFEAFYQQLSDCMERKKALLEQQAAAHAAAEKLAEWGRFVPAELRELKEQGWEIHIYRTDKKTMAALEADPDVRFVRLAPVGKMPTLAAFAPLPGRYSATEFPVPDKGLDELEQEQQSCDKALADCEAFLTQAAAHLPSIRTPPSIPPSATRPKVRTGWCGSAAISRRRRGTASRRPLPRRTGHGPWRSLPPTMTRCPQR